METITNTDRATWVAPLVREFAREHYYGGEALAVVVQDIITNLGHLLDRPELAPELEPVPVDGGPTNLEQVVNWALFNYDEEVAVEPY